MTFSEYFDRQSCNGKQSFRKCRCCECLCSELLLNLNLCHILSLFTWLLLLMFSSFIATLYLAAMRSCGSGGALCLSLTASILYFSVLLKYLNSGYQILSSQYCYTYLCTSEHLHAFKFMFFA